MDNGINPNSKRLLWAGFFAIFANGVGFSVRAGILADWAAQYGFTQTELGSISGGGLIGFGIVILIGALIADRVGYGKLMALAFLLHIVAGVMQLFTGEIYSKYGKEMTALNLWWALFLYSVANGICEAVVNPMTATLFPKQKTHYLNILHAGWPGGLIVGGLIAYFMHQGKIGDWTPVDYKVSWELQMSLFLIPVAIYGWMFLGQRLPRSEASEAGVSYGSMLVAIMAPMFFLLLILHAMVGYVELGTDSWIGKITGTIVENKQLGLLLFVYTSGLMFALRFFAGPIVHKISPLGLLFVSAICAAIGLLLLGNAPTAIWFVFIAVTVYGIGKTFYWSTMLAVASEQFPKGGAIAIGALGGVGMLSAGLLGAPGIGFQQDYFATNKLIAESPPTYERYAAAKENSFLGLYHVKGLDGAKLDVLEKHGVELERAVEVAQQRDEKNEATNALLKLNTWWSSAKEYEEVDSQPVKVAVLYGGQEALKWTALVPAIMAVLYLAMIIYFRTQGGYKAVSITEPESHVTERF